MQHLIKTIDLSFNYRLQQHQIPFFRKKVWDFVGWGAEVFHNHDIEEGTIIGNKHRYPLVQYRTCGGYANMWGVNEGAEALLRLGENAHFLPALHKPIIEPFTMCLTPYNEPQLYKLFGYVPFHKNAYQEYRQAANFRARIAILERILTNHLVAFVYGVGWELDKTMPLQVVLHDITEVGRAVYQPADKSAKNVYTAFDLSFYVNIELPDQAGIGCLTALGYGLLKRWEEINHY